VSIKDHIGWVQMNKLLIMYYRIWDFWGPANLVVLCVAETETILPYITDVKWDSAWATNGCLSRYRVEDMH
jgi:hypothetical protein